MAADGSRKLVATPSLRQPAGRSSRGVRAGAPLRSGLAGAARAVRRPAGPAWGADGHARETGARPRPRLASRTSAQPAPPPVPPAPPRLPPSRDASYRLRALGGLAASLAVVNAAAWFWPNGLGPDAPEIPDARPREQIVIELVEPTRQPPPTTPFPPAPPPPPAPSDAPPVEVPDERLIEDLDLPIPSVAPPVPQPDAPRAAGPPAPPAPPAPPPPRPGPVAPPSDRIVDRPQRSPRIVKTSPPVCPPDVRRAGETVEARVRVLVSQKGQVETAEIEGRTVTDRRDRSQAVPALPYGLDGAMLEAARRHLFRPARDGDASVRSYTTLTLRCSAGE